jgi:hypothetical protein
MGYQRQEASTGPLLTVEQARRRNAEIRLELARLAAEHQQLEPQVNNLRAEVSKARKILTRKVRDLEASRIQAEHLARVSVAHGEPVHGGPEGLLAATAEMEAHEYKFDVLGRRRRILGPSHGTRSKYAEGCRCDDCMDWRRRKSESERVAQQRRRSEKKLAA